MRAFSHAVHNVTMTVPLAIELEGDVDHAVVPITLGMRPGAMRLANGRLRYTRKFRNRVLFDAPVQEFHSFARSSWGTGFHLWHGTTRYRFAAYNPVVPMELGTGVVSELADSVSAFNRSLVATALSRSTVDRWHDALVPLIAPHPPPTVRVRPPLSPVAFVLAALGFAVSFTLLLIATVAAIVLASG